MLHINRRCGGPWIRPPFYKDIGQVHLPESLLCVNVRLADYLSCKIFLVVEKKSDLWSGEADFRIRVVQFSVKSSNLHFCNRPNKNQNLICKGQTSDKTINLAPKERKPSRYLPLKITCLPKAHKSAILMGLFWPIFAAKLMSITK